MVDISSRIKNVEIRKASEYSTQELVARVAQFATNTCSTWMLEMGGDLSNVVPANIAVIEAVNELQVRRKQRNLVMGAKNFVQAAVDGRKLEISPAGYSTITPEQRIPMIVKGGHIIPESNEKDVEVRSQIRLENIIDIMTFPQTKDPKSKDNKVIIPTTVVAERDAVKLNMPMYPVVSVFGDSKREDIAYTLRLKCKAGDKKNFDIAFATNLLKRMPCDIPNTDVKMRWFGFAYNCPPPLRTPSTLNWQSFYTTLAEHRLVRGGDTGIRSFSSVGYYYGYMPAPMYRAAYVVHDLMALAHQYGNQIMNLEINAMDGLFTAPVLTSLVANGWVIRVVNGHEFPDFVVTDDVPKPKPKIYHRVKSDESFMVYVPLMEDQPKIESGKLVMSDVMSEVELRIANQGTRICFSYIYLRDALVDFVDYLMPSAHAHNGQALFVNKKMNDRPPLTAYLQRCVLANGFKTSHVYNRLPFYFDDPMRSPVRFCLFFKEPKQQDNKLVMNYNVTSKLIEMQEEFDVEIPDNAIRMALKYKKKKDELSDAQKKDVALQLDHDNVVNDIGVQVVKRPSGNEFGMDSDTTTSYNMGEQFSDSDDT